MPTIGSLLRDAGEALLHEAVPGGARDAEVLLAHLLGVDRGALHARPEREVDPEVAAAFERLVVRRMAREPLQYLTGLQEFWSLPFRVTPAVLIPRPETELILETALRLALPSEPLVLDLGTGSGCLAVAAAHEMPRARVVATDLSEEALEVARGNAVLNAVGERIEFLAGDLFGALAGRGFERSFDAILSNPPYIPAGELAALAPELRNHEPRIALTPGPDGLALHRRIAALASRWLLPDGILLVEIGFSQAEAARAIYGAGPGLEVIEIASDLAGIPRVLLARSSRS